MYTNDEAILMYSNDEKSCLHKTSSNYFLCITFTLFIHSCWSEIVKLKLQQYSHSWSNFIHYMYCSGSICFHTISGPSISFKLHTVCMHVYVAIYVCTRSCSLYYACCCCFTVLLSSWIWLNFTTFLTCCCYNTSLQTYC